ncbi:MAG TPA: hypothetical protein VF766_05215 [Pyrinomonadaceae bacterium]
MKYSIAAIAALLVFVGGVSFAQPKDSAVPCQDLNQQIVSLAGEYKELRERRKRLPQGTLDRDISGDGGRLSKVLSALGTELGHPPYTKKIVTNCLGEPDAIRSHEKMRNFLEIYNRELRKAGREVEDKREREYLIYFWRGWHDFLFFIVEEGVIVDHGWWFAYE